MKAEDILDCFYALEELISDYLENEELDIDTKTALLVIASKKQIDLSKKVKHIYKSPYRSSSDYPFGLRCFIRYSRKTGAIWRKHSTLSTSN
jgi:hypothetical protein